MITLKQSSHFYYKRLNLNSNKQQNKSNIRFNKLSTIRTDTISFGNKSIPSCDIKIFEKMIENFEYVRDFERILKNGFKVVFEKGKIVFKNFDIPENENKGVCHNLSKKLLKRLKNSELAKKYIFSGKCGQDNMYFYKSKSNHFFIEAKQINSGKKLIIDPSFKKIGTYEELKYKTKSEATFDFSKDRVIEQDFFYPLGFADKLGINFSNLNNPIVHMSVDSTNSTFDLYYQEACQEAKIMDANTINQIIANTTNTHFKNFLLEVADSGLFTNFYTNNAIEKIKKEIQGTTTAKIAEKLGIPVQHPKIMHEKIIKDLVFYDTNKNDREWLLKYIDEVLQTEDKGLIKLLPERGYWSISLTEDEQRIIVLKFLNNTDDPEILRSVIKYRLENNKLEKLKPLYEKARNSNDIEYLKLAADKFDHYFYTEDKNAKEFVDRILFSKESKNPEYKKIQKILTNELFEFLDEENDDIVILYKNWIKHQSII